MRLRGILLITWGVACGVLFLVLFVSKLRSGQTLAYLYMAAALTAAVLSIEAGRKLLTRPG